MTGRSPGGPERDRDRGSDPLRAAAEAVLERWKSQPAAPSLDPAEARETVERVVRQIDGWWRAGAPFDESELPDAVLGDRIAKALRAELLRRWSEGEGEADPDETLAILAALEDFRTLLWGGPEEENLAARLAEPDAFELTVGLAHDLRSPLSSILFLAETLRSGHSGSLNELQRSQLGLIYSASFGILSVANDVMEMAKAGRGGGGEEPSPFSVQELLETVEEMVRPIAEEKEVALEVRVPECRPRVGTPTLLGRVLLNLASNALKFTEEGGVTVSVEKRGAKTLRFSVRDTGRGISPEKQKTLFRPFLTSEAREGSFFSSSGLGLTIVRRLLSSMDAELELETAPGEGTRFFFDLELPPARTH